MKTPTKLMNMQMSKERTHLQHVCRSKPINYSLRQLFVVKSPCGFTVYYATVHMLMHIRWCSGANECYVETVCIKVNPMQRGETVNNSHYVQILWSIWPVKQVNKAHDALRKP